MKLQVKTTFSFAKMAREMPKILEKHMQRTGRSSATGAKEAIDRGVSPPLKKSTIGTNKLFIFPFLFIRSTEKPILVLELV